MNTDDRSLEILVKRKDDIESSVDYLNNIINYDHDYDDTDWKYEVEAYYNSPEYQLSELGVQLDEINSQIQRIYLNKEKTEYKNEYDVKMENYSKGHMLSDSAKTEDLFDRKSCAKTIARYIVDEKTMAPFNIGIFAPWGEGKTTFMNYVSDEIKLFNEDKYDNTLKTHIVNYDASEYEDQDKIWASLLKSLFITYEASISFPKIRYKYYQYFSNWKKSIKNITPFFFSIIFILLFSFVGTSLTNDFSKQWKILIGGAATVSAVLVFITNFVVPGIKVLLQTSVPLSNMIINSISLPNYIEKLGERECIKMDLQILLKAWLKNYKLGCNERIVLFIDDLDRCSEKGVIEFFQSLQLFLKVPQIVIVFAIDYGYLKKTLNKEFTITDEAESDEYISEYLDKYINIPLFLNTSIDYEVFLDYLLENIIIDNNTFAFSEGEKQAIKKCLLTIPTKLLTPRKIKKIINMLLFSKELCVLINQNRDKTNIVDFRGYSRWFVFSYFYVDITKKLIEKLTACNQHQILLSLEESLSSKEKIELFLNTQIFSEISSLRGIDIYEYEKMVRGFINRR